MKNAALETRLISSKEKVHFNLVTVFLFSSQVILLWVCHVNFFFRTCLYSFYLCNIITSALVILVGLHQVNWNETYLGNQLIFYSVYLSLKDTRGYFGWYLILQNSFIFNISVISAFHSYTALNASTTVCKQHQENYNSQNHHLSCMTSCRADENSRMILFISKTDSVYKIDRFIRRFCALSEKAQRL